MDQQTTKAKDTIARPRAKPAATAPVYHAAPLIDGPDSLAAALERLKQADPETINAMLAVAGPPPLRLNAPGFAGLAAIIVSQQVSVASANAIFSRLQALVQPLEAAGIRAVSEADLRQCGLSAAKVRTFQALAAEIVERGLDLAGLGSLAAADAHRALVAVKGIGPWTADIFLLSCLGHPDAWPVGDVALQEAARLALGLETRPDARELETIGERWRPQRAVAARLLWHYYRARKTTAAGLAEG